jgi:hypothetical protein
MRSIALAAVCAAILAIPSLAETEPPIPGIVGLLSRTMSGQPVVAVNGAADSTVLPSVRFRQGDSLRSWLQTVSAGAGSNLIPFAWRGTWVIAPDTCKELDSDESHRDFLDRFTRPQLIRWALATLPDDVVPLLGVRDGISISRLPDDPRTYLQHALCSPLVLQRVRRTRSGAHTWNVTTDAVKHVDDPLDWSRVRLRATIRSTDVREASQGARIRRPITRESEAIFIYGDEGSSGNGGIRDPEMVNVPNRLKPSDLNVLPFRKPVGFRGVCTVGDLLKRISAAAGTPLTAAPAYQDRLAFVGSESLAIRDVLDGIRLSLCATWRRLGDTYVLVWERPGIGGLELAAAESSMDLRAQAMEANTKDLFDTRWWSFLKRIPFAPDDPLALTTAQRARVFADPPTDPKAALETEVTGPPRIPYAQMTPAQQDAIREAMDEPSDAANMALDSRVEIKIEAYLPGFGWARIPTESFGAIYGDQLYIQIARSIWQMAEPADGQPREAPVIPLGRERAVMVPVLPPERIAALADQMRRHGFTTVYYPALFDGYATYPSRAFPLHPMLKGQDGWALMSAAMAARGIRVIGYLNTLAWRNLDDRAHWLDAHPDWLDRDVLGRSRRAWVALHPAFPWHVMEDGMPFTGDYVRPTEPQVATRLDTVLKELARRNASGVAFAQWRPSGWSTMQRGLTPPPLGFAPAERVSAFRATSRDPADDPLPLQNLRIPALEELAGLRPYDSAPDPSITPYVTLLKHLLESAAQLRRDWLTIVIDDAGGPGFEMDSPDIRRPPYSVKAGLVVSPSMGADAAVGLLYPLWPAGTARQPQWIRKASPNPGPALLYYSYYSGSVPSEKRPVSLLDFRQAPEDIVSSLALVEPPATKQGDVKS